MSQRWEQTAARYDEEKPKLAAQMASAPSVKDQAEQATQAAQHKTSSQSEPRDGRVPVSGAYRS
jgi:hypothetical protein